MGNHIIVYTKYLSGKEFGGGIELGKFIGRTAGTPATPTNRLEVKFEGEGGIKSAQIYLDFDVAIPLARALLSVAEGYVSESESEIA